MNNKIYIFYSKNSILEFLSFIKDKNKGYIRFYSDNLFNIFLEIISNLEEIKNNWNFSFFISNNEIYELVLKSVNKRNIIYLKNIEKIINLPLEDFLKKNNIVYERLIFWDNTTKYALEDYNLNSPFAQTIGIEFYKKMLGFGGSLAKEELRLKASLADEELKKIIDSSIENLKKNNNILIKCLSLLNKEYSALNKNWDYASSLSIISYEIFIKNFNIFDIKIKNPIEQDKLFRLAFYGGRCEVLGNLYYDSEYIYRYDYSNMYGSLLLNDFPYEFIGKKTNSSIEDLIKPGFFFIKFTSNMEIPILPHKKLITNELSEYPSLMFTNGEIEGLYWHKEILLALEHKKIIIKEISYFLEFNTELKPLFKQFAENIIKKRENSANKHSWKAILVSFFGKLGMKPRESKCIITNHSDYAKNILNKEILKEIWFKNIGLIEIAEKKEEVNSLVQYAAIVTSEARIKLYNTINAVQKNGGRVLYLDTDELFIAYPKNKNIWGEQHGDIFWDKNDKKIIHNIKDAVFASNRSYSVLFEDNSWETKISSIPRNKISFDEYKKKFYKEGGIWVQDMHNYQNIFSINFYSKSNWKFEYIKPYSKRIFSPDFKKTKPYYKINDIYKEI